MKSSYLIAGTIALATTGWMLSGQLTGATAQAPSATETAVPSMAAAPDTALTRVRVSTLKASTIDSAVLIKGQTAADRRVLVPAQIEGVVEAVLVERGSTVKAGDELARIAVEDREASLRQARALVEQRRIESNAAQALNAKGYQTQVRAAEAKALLNSAEAALKSAELAVSHTSVKAPFDGIIEARSIELGGFVSRGAPLVSLIDLDPITVQIDVSERDIGKLRLGAIGQVTLLDGQQIDAAIAFIAPVGNPATRTFRVELEAENPDGAIREGLTAEVNLLIGQTQAHKISPAILALSSTGQIGVKIVEEGKVRFIAVSLLRDEVDGIWVGGLPETATVITVGQEFVKDGQSVDTVDANLPGAA